MSSSQQPSFAIKSSHRLVNPPLEDTSNSYFDDNVTKSTSNLKGWTKTDSERKESSTKGMVIRTTNTSVEDFY